MQWRFDDDEPVARYIRYGRRPGAFGDYRRRWMGPARIELQGDDGCMYSADLPGVDLPETYNLFIVWINPSRPPLRTASQRILDPVKVKPDHVRLIIAGDVEFVWQRGVDGLTPAD